MARVNLGLDIGTASVKAVELINNRNGYELRNLIKIDLPWMQENIEKEAITAKLIKGLIDKYKVNTRRVISGVKGESVIIRRIRMPLMGQREINQAVRWQAEEHIPYSLDQICLSFQVLERNLMGEEGEDMSVILVGVKKEAIRKHLHVLTSAGVFPRIVDVDALALFNVFQLSNPEDKDKVALLEIGHNNTSIVILDKGYPFLIRDINWGGFHLTQAVKKGLKVSYEVAQKMKERYGIDAEEIDLSRPVNSENESEEKNKRLVNAAIRKAMNTLVKEIVHSFEYYTSQKEGTAIKRVILSGGTSCLRNIDKFLSEELGLSVETINPFTIITGKPAGFQPEYLSKRSSLFTVGLGLALRKIKKI